MKKQDLKSLSRKELKKWFQEKGYPAYRAEQIFNWIYRNGVEDFTAMKNIPAELRRELEEKAYVNSNLALEEARYAGMGQLNISGNWKMAISLRVFTCPIRKKNAIVYVFPARLVAP